MSDHILQVDITPVQLEEFSMCANVCGVRPQDIQIRYKPYGEHRHLRIEIDQEQAGNMTSYLALKSVEWRWGVIQRCQSDPLGRLWTQDSGSQHT